ncbi:Gfo/Idh/MocA family oxidoreductase [Brevibacillus humidisoli]|uniref:Gfo/Idh/MocA family protein n=1 Tax=Brevibacillus humidisoli TaxID=2895522 RepID=UPI001E64B639|nr:Gfo/Idh/MocA family oxidoreductase [Brevibacillus humidisoli]UFJ42916.1 Gfo/Idh/MocA family oxidoreductase [Brevibacillus humidisoli]
MRKPRIGVIGLGSIAQKAYLPILSQQQGWSLVGAFSPTQSKRDDICAQYRIQSFPNMAALVREVDAVFVHSSTETHYEVVAKLLSKGIDVYVDKPLAATLEEAEGLAVLCAKTGRKVMVGFNRRFAPLYVQAKAEAGRMAWIRTDKHRIDGIRDEPHEQTLLDDYIHLVDLVRWLAADEVKCTGGRIVTDERGRLLYAQHSYLSNVGVGLSTAMHRRAGSNREHVEWTADGHVIRVTDLEVWEREEKGLVMRAKPASWDTILKRRGFEGAVLHFMESIIGDSKPSVDADEAYKSQLLLEELIKLGSSD